MRPHEGDGGDFSRLTDLEVFEQAATAGVLPALIDRLLRAAAARAEGDPHGEALARAVRVDLAFLVDHPGEVFPCV